MCGYLIVNSIYSFLFGHINIKQLCQKIKENNLKYVAISDINGMFGYIELIEECLKFNMIPVLGITLRMKIENKIGTINFIFRSLIGLRFFYKYYNEIIIKTNDSNIIINIDSIPYHDEIIVITGSKGSIFYKFFENNDAENVLLQLKNKYFDNFYLGYARLENEIEKKLSNFAVKMISKGYQTIISYPVVHLQPEESNKHATMLSVNKNIKVSDIVTDINNEYYYGGEYYLRSVSEFEQIYLDEDSVSLKNLNYIFKNIKPIKSIFDGINLSETIINIEQSENKIIFLSYTKFQQKVKEIFFGEDKKILEEIYNKILYELYMYKKLKLFSILYVVYDFMKFAKKNNIKTGPGRGSCVGSLVIYLLDITKVNPIKYDLMFERFINEDRYSTADIDIDICKDRRNDIFNYLKEKYNKNNFRVIHIIVFLKFMIKSSIKDISKSLGNSVKFQEINNIIKNTKEENEIIDRVNLIYNSIFLLKENKNILNLLEFNKNINNVYFYTSKSTFKVYKKIILIFKKLILNFKFFQTFSIFKNYINENNLNNIDELLKYFNFDFSFENYKNNRKINLFNFKKHNFINFNYIKNKLEFLVYSISKKVYEKLSKKINSIKKSLKFASNFVNCIKSTGVHAAGILITNSNIDLLMPVYFGHNSMQQKLITTQFDFETLNKFDIFKFDILGLENLTLIDLLSKKLNINIDYDAIVEKPEIYNYARNGYTRNIFQMDRLSVAKLAYKINVNNFNDIVAINALNRPGTLGLVSSYLSNRKNWFNWQKNNKDLKIFNIVKDTFGIILFQEQVIKIANEIAGFTKTDSDFFRYIIGKKKIDLLPLYKNKFINGCINNQESEENAIEYFKIIEKFAGYAFNKSHAVAYSYITAATLYLKSLSPVLFLCTSMEFKIRSKNKIIEFASELFFLRKRIYFLSPNIYNINSEFSFEDKKITYIQIPLLLFGGFTEENIIINEKYDFKSKNIEEILNNLNFGQAIIKKLYDCGVFRYFNYSEKEILKLIDIKKKRKKIIKDNLELFSFDIKKYSHDLIQRNVNINFDILNSIKNQIILKGFSLLKINICSLIYIFLKNNENVYLSCNLGENGYSIININKPYIYYFIKNDNFEIFDLLIEKKENNKIIYFNITKNVISTNSFMFDEFSNLITFELQNESVIDKLELKKNDYEIINKFNLSIEICLKKELINLNVVLNLIESKDILNFKKL